MPPSASQAVTVQQSAVRQVPVFQMQGVAYTGGVEPRTHQVQRGRQPSPGAVYHSTPDSLCEGYVPVES